jgi:hypothetical protein
MIVWKVNWSLVFETELAFITWAESVHGADLVSRKSLAKKVDSCHLTAEKAIIV